MFYTLQQVERFFKQRQSLGMKPGLERIHELLHRMGNPEKNIKAIHIAGTNGKGSTLHFIQAALLANQYDVGVFTSPSFHGIQGHIFLNEQVIPASELVALLNEAHPHVKAMDQNKMAPTEFEILTALAFRYFAKNGDIVLIEAGMGGRFDTTNSFHPILSIITNIAQDHMEYLGGTPEEIAYHKAGIIKRESPVIIGNVDDSALTVLKQEAHKNNASTYQLGKEFITVSHGEHMLWKTKKNEYRLKINLRGEHQKRNASLALKALENLEEIGFPINWETALHAMEIMQLPGRFECIHKDPIVIVDAAHNPDGMKAFIETVNREYPTEDKSVIVAMFSDKATDDMLELLSESFTEIILTSFEHPRAWNPYNVKGIDHQNIKSINLDYRAVLHTAMQKDKIIFITGSLQFITEIRRFLLREK